MTYSPHNSMSRNPIPPPIDRPHLKPLRTIDENIHPADHIHRGGPIPNKPYPRSGFEAREPVFSPSHHHHAGRPLVAPIERPLLRPVGGPDVLLHRRPIEHVRAGVVPGRLPPPLSETVQSMQGSAYESREMVFSPPPLRTSPIRARLERPVLRQVVREPEVVVHRRSVPPPLSEPIPMVAPVVEREVVMSPRRINHSPPPVIPFDKPLSKRVEEASGGVIRCRSVEPVHRGLLSEKVPMTFDPMGVTLHPISFATLEGEQKISLYSEVERLSIFNLELKKQNDMLLTELEEYKVLASRVPEMEQVIHTLQKEILKREQSLNQTVQEQEILKVDNINLSKLGPAYNELLEHNKALISEIDSLDFKLSDILQERDLLEARAESVKILKPRLEDATRRIEIMTQDIMVREQELAEYNARIQDLTSRLNTLMLENEQIHNRCVDQMRERDALLMRIEEMHKAHEIRIMDTKVQVENANRALLEHERIQISNKFSMDMMKKEEELNQARELMRSFENRVLLLANEVEHLEKINLSKAGELDDLKMRIALLEEEKIEARRAIELESSVRIEKHLGQQKIHYESIIDQLRRENNELDRLRILVKQKENEIEMLRAQLANNEKVWEMRLQQAVSNEAKSATNKIALEMSVLETEVSMSKDTVIKLENQITFLSSEIERLTNAQNQKLVEVNDLQRRISSQEMNFRVTLEEQRTKLELERKQALEDLRRDLERVHMERADEMRKFQMSLEEKVLVLMDENKRLSGLVEDRSRDVDNYSVKLRVIEDQYKQQIDEVHKKSVVSQKSALEKEISMLTMRHKGEKAELEARIAQYTSDLERLRTQCQLQSVEIERAVQALKDKELENQQEKRKYVELEIQRTRDITEVREQFDSYKRANVDVNSLQIRFEAERTSLTSQIVQQKEKVGELEKRLALFVGENEKMRDLYNEKSNELEGFRQKYRALEEKWQHERSSLENEIEHLKRAQLDNKEFSIRFASEKAQYENQIKQLKIINENGKQELEKLYELMNQRKKDHDYYVKQNEDLKKEVDRLSRQLRDAGSETSSRKDRYEELERAIVDLERDRDLYKDHNERLNIQLQQTYAELQDKIRELDASKRKYDESISKMSAQLDKDLMTKMTVSTVVGKKENGSASSMEF